MMSATMADTCPASNRGGVILCVAVAFALVACGGAAAPAEVRLIADDVVALDVAWAVDLGERQTFDLHREELGGVAMSDTGPTLVVATTAGSVYGLHVDDGRVVWEADLGGEALAAQPVVADGVAYVPASDGVLYALSADAGTVQWRFDSGSVFHSRPVAAGERVYITAADATLYAIRSATGRAVWQFEHRLRGDMTVIGDCTPLVTDAGVYVGFPDGALALIDLDGDARWLADLSRGESRLRDADATPLVAGDAVYASSFSGGLHRRDAETGDAVWWLDATGATDPVAVDDHLVTTTASGRVLWVAPESGTIDRELELDAPSVGSAVRWGSELLLVPSPQRGLYIVDARTPWVFGRFEPGEGFSTAPVVAGARVYALSNGGFVYALDASRNRSAGRAAH